MAVSADAPSLDLVYKLAEYAGRGRTKLAREKPILPGRKQLFREYQDGTAIGDVIGRAEEHLNGDPLLNHVMQNGKRIEPAAPLPSIHEAAAARIASLPPRVTSLEPADPPYPVRIRAALLDHYERVRSSVI
jgi:nicotinate phosphoribosyltransferase